MTHGRLDEMHPAPDTPRFRSELDAYLHARTGPRTRRARRTGRWLAVAGVAVVAAVAMVLVGPVTGDRPQSVALARGTLVLDDDTRIPVSDFLDAANFDRLRTAFKDADATLVIDEVPVAAAAEGRVLEVAFYGSDRPTATDFEITVAPGDRVEVTVGRPARDGERVTTEGLTPEEVFPEIHKAVRYDDPVATGEALEQLGFTVEWLLIDFEPDGTHSHGERVEAPPPGTYVLSVLGPGGQRIGMDPDIDSLIVEITPDREEAELHLGVGGGE